MLKNFLRDEDGQGMVEYVLIIALIGIVLTVALSALAQNIGNTFNQVGDELAVANGGGNGGN